MVIAPRLQPCTAVTVQNQVQKKMIKRHGKHKMCEAAASVTRHTVLQPSFFIRGKSTLYNNDKSIVNT